MTRRVTNKIYDALADGTLTYAAVAEAALGFMSEADVAHMARSNEFFAYEDELDDDDDDEEDEDEEE